MNKQKSESKYVPISFKVTEEQIREWNSPERRLIQEIFPNLSPCEREYIKMRTTPQEWVAVFGACYMKKLCVYYQNNKKCKYSLKLKR